MKADVSGLGALQGNIKGISQYLLSPLHKMLSANRTFYNPSSCCTIIEVSLMQYWISKYLPSSPGFERRDNIKLMQQTLSE